MVDWEKKMLENRKQKQQEKENEKQEHTKREADKDANRKKAISFISEKAVPAFEKARSVLQGGKLNMHASYRKLEGDTSIEIKVSPKKITRVYHETFQYRVEMEYTSSTVTPYAVCPPQNRYKIEKTDNDSATPKLTIQLINITETDIYNDLMKHFSNFDAQHYEDNPPRPGVVKYIPRKK